MSFFFLLSLSDIPLDVKSWIPAGGEVEGRTRLCSHNKRD